MLLVSRHSHAAAALSAVSVSCCNTTQLAHYHEYCIVIIAVRWLDPEGSLSARMVVLVVVITRFRKMPNGTESYETSHTQLHIRDIIPDRSTVLDFYEMALPSGSVVPFVLVSQIVHLCRL